MTRYQKASETHRKNWANMSDEERIKRGKAISVGKLKNITEEFRRGCSERAKLQMANMSEEEKKIKSMKLSESNKKRYASMSEEKRKEIGMKISQGQLNIPEERKKEINRKRSESMKRYIRGLSIKERKKRNDKVQNWWDTMSVKDYDIWSYKRSEGFNKYLDNLSINPNKNENAFMDILKLNQIDHQFQYLSSKKHPDFEKLFPFNPISGSKRVEAYHSWDFIIHTKEKDVLVDVDGSIHGIDIMYKDYTVTARSGKKISLHDYIQFNDSKRPYQTDGLDAYIIKCYDDKLTYDTLVESVNGKESYTLFQFITILKMYNGYKVKSMN